jgi:hypothetical protein
VLRFELVTVSAEQVPVQVLTKFVAPVIAPVMMLEGLLELIVRLTRSVVPPDMDAAPEPELIVKVLPADVVWPYPIIAVPEPPAPPTV